MWYAQVDICLHEHTTCALYKSTSMPTFYVFSVKYSPGLKSQSKSALNSAVSEILWISALITAVSELFSAGFLWISAVQRWIKTNRGTDENASCKFEKVLGSRKTCSFGVYQLWKNHSGKIPVKNSNWRTRLFLMLLGRTWPVE